MAKVNKLSLLEAEKIGGKASSLQFLTDHGFLVPKWMVFSWSELTDLDSNIVEEKIHLFFGANTKHNKYAVRSSASLEDGTQHSFAGVFESYLDVSYDEITRKMELVSTSIHAPRVVEYLKNAGITEELKMSVVVQEMIASEVSGVAFGINPVTGDLNTKVINSVFGLGESLVSGDITADTYYLKNQTIESSIADKGFQYLGTDRGVEKVALETSKSSERSLTDTQIYEVAEVLERLDLLFGAAQDIEFCYFQNQLYVLQSRPITTFNEADYILWDNSNIIESYPGITTPFTFSFIEKMYEMVYKQLVGLMGVEQKEIERNTLVFENTLGLVRGRVYYNLLSWYKMLAMVPGYSLNAQFMETMMGVKERFDLKEKYQMSKGKAWFRIVLMLFKMIRLQVNLPKERDKFYKQVAEKLTKYHAIDYSILSSKQIVEHYVALEHDLLLKWKAPLVNDFFSMIWFGMLKKKVAELVPEEINLHNDLLCGSKDIISVEPIHQIFDLVHNIKQDSKVEQLFLTNTAYEVWNSLQSSEEYSSALIQINKYLNTFGDRCVGELKLESISYVQDPSAFVKLIQSYLKNHSSNIKQVSGIEIPIRERAETLVFEKLKNKGFLTRWWFNRVLSLARAHVSNRENLRYERTKAFGLVRKIINALGLKLEEENQIEHHIDVFYLELNEVKSLVEKPLDSAIKSLISTRKSTFESYKSQQIPQQRFFTYGKVFSDEYIYSAEKLEVLTGDLSGIGCCPGIVEAKVTVVHHPEEVESLNQTMLVTNSTDPGWVTLFPSCAAIIVERGSLLSHSAIVSREMGIPCIVNVNHLLRTLKTGDTIRMNGSTGEIKIINS